MNKSSPVVRPRAAKVAPPEARQSQRMEDAMLRVSLRTLQAIDPCLAAFVRKGGWRWCASVDPEVAAIVAGVRREWSQS